MKTRRNAQLDALMELHRQTLAVLQEALSLLKSMHAVPQPVVPYAPYAPYIGSSFPPTIQSVTWGPKPGGFTQMNSSRTMDVGGVGG